MSSSESKYPLILSPSIVVNTTSTAVMITKSFLTSGSNGSICTTPAINRITAIAVSRMTGTLSVIFSVTTSGPPSIGV